MPRHHAEPISLRGVHVLVVCDDLQRCTLFAQALRYAGALVMTSHSADDANAVMNRLHPNVIVVELRDADTRRRLIASLQALPEERGGKSPAAADGPIKTAILGETNARLYKYERRAALATDRIAALKAEDEVAGGERSNLRYGYVARARG